MLLGESENEPGSRTTLWGLRAADAVVFTDKDQMLGSLLQESDIDGPGSIVRERILEGVGEKLVHDDAKGDDQIGRQRQVLDLGTDDNRAMAGEGLAHIGASSSTKSRTSMVPSRSCHRSRSCIWARTPIRPSIRSKRALSFTGRCLCALHRQHRHDDLKVVAGAVGELPKQEILFPFHRIEPLQQHPERLGHQGDDHGTGEKDEQGDGIGLGWNGQAEARLR